MHSPMMFILHYKLL